MIQMSLTAKRWITSFWRTAVFTCSCWLTFFLFRCGFQEKREPSWKNYLIWTADWCGVHSTPDPQKALIIFLSVISKMQVIFWSEDNFCFISDCRNAFYCKLKKLINEQIIIFYSPSNALTSSDESVQNILTSYFNWYIFPSHMVIPVNEDTSSLKQIEQMCKLCVIVKTRCFYNFTID